MWKCVCCVLGMLALGGTLTADEPKSKEAKPPSFKAPKGWEEAKPDTAGITTARFSIGEGEKQVAVTLTRARGGLPANVNRWRGQVGLKALGDAEALQTLQPTKVDGLPAHLLDIVGPSAAPGADGKLQRIVVVIVPQGEEAWFVRLSGPADPVGKHKGAFDEFVKSFRFEK